jgi:RHS repeat-associated protein
MEVVMRRIRPSSPAPHTRPSTVALCATGLALVMPAAALAQYCDATVADWWFDRYTADWRVTSARNECCCNSSSEDCGCRFPSVYGVGEMIVDGTPHWLYTVNGTGPYTGGPSPHLQCLRWQNGSYQVTQRVGCDCVDCGTCTSEVPIGSVEVYKTPELYGSSSRDRRGRCLIKIRYDFPQTKGSWHRALQWRELPSGNSVGIGYRDCGGYCTTLPRSSWCCVRAYKFQGSVLEVSALACGGNDPSERATAVFALDDCGESCENPFCEEVFWDDPRPDQCPGEPERSSGGSGGSFGSGGAGGVRFPNGNMRYVDSEPLPTSAAPIDRRTYDSRSDRDGVFGRGWTSIFDGEVENYYPNLTTGLYYRVITESNQWVMFSSASGSLVQVWPMGRAAGMLREEPGHLVYRQPSGSLERLYRTSDGRLERIDDLSSGRSVVLSYDARGFPTAVEDAWGNWFWTVAEDPRHPGRVGTIVTSEGVSWSYTYGARGDLDVLESVLVDGAVWRTYDYDPDGRLTRVEDGQGHLIEQHDYHPSGEFAGWVRSSVTATEHIAQIDYHITDPQRPLDDGEYAVRLTLSSGATSEYYIAPHDTRHDRVQEVRGGCGCPGEGEFLALKWNSFGITRKQNSLGEITVYAYDDADASRVSQIERGYRLPGCEPGADPSNPHCRVADAAELRSLDLSGQTPASVTTYDFRETRWRDRPTSVCRPSVVSDPTPDTSCRLYRHDDDTGTVLAESTTGRTWDHDTDRAAWQERTVRRTLYSGEAAAFDPILAAAELGTRIAFDTAWLTLPQPHGMVRELDGPLAGADVTRFVYYPVDPSVIPAELRGRLAAEMDAVGNVTVFDDYDAFGRVRRRIDARGVTTELKYDAVGRMISSTVLGNCDPHHGFDMDPECGQDLVTEYLYPPGSGPLELVRRPSGVSVTTYEHDIWGRVTAVSQGPSETDLRERVTYRYGLAEWGRHASEQLQRCDSTACGVSEDAWVTTRRVDFEYDGLGRLYQASYPRFAGDSSPPAEIYGYDPAGNVTSFQDGAHHDASDPNVQYSYDLFGRLTAVHQLVEDVVSPVWARIGYRYDSNGALILVRDANGNETTYQVDDFGQTYRISSPVTGTSELTYDAAGRLTTRVDGRGAVQSLSYDTIGKVTRVSHRLDGVTETVNFSHDHGLRVAAVAEGGSGQRVVERWSYGRGGLLTSAERDIDSGWELDTERIELGYDLDGHLVLRRRGCEEVRYAVDHAGRPVSITGRPADCSGLPLTFASNIEYLPFGPPTAIARSARLGEAMSYDWQYRMTSQTVTVDSTSVLDRVYWDQVPEDGYDGNGNLLHVVDRLLPQRTRHLSYDGLGRLVHAAAPLSFSALDLSYDLIGNRTRMAIGPAGRQTVTESSYLGELSPVMASYEVTRPGGSPTTFTLEHDAAGNLVDDDVSTFGYSPANRMVVQQSPGRDPVTFAYDTNGLRAATRQGSRATHHFLLPDSRPYHERVFEEGVGIVEGRSLVFLGDRLLCTFDSAGTTAHVASDHIALPLAVYDNRGMTLWEAEALPFGEIRAVHGGTAASDPLLRYPGQWQLDRRYVTTETNLVYNGYRWYRPDWGRYTQSDPIPSPPRSSMPILHVGRFTPFAHLDNIYVYAASGPKRFTDPLGLLCCEPGDECPSGVWSYSGASASFGGPGAFFHGASGGRGSYKCEGSPANVDVSYHCDMTGFFGIFGAGGFGREADLGFMKAEGCNRSDLLGDFTGGFTLVGPIGVVWLHKTGGPYSLTGSLSFSFGGGAGRISCRFRERV